MMGIVGFAEMEAGVTVETQRVYRGHAGVTFLVVVCVKNL